MKPLICRKCKLREIDKELSHNYCFLCLLVMNDAETKFKEGKITNVNRK